MKTGIKYLHSYLIICASFIIRIIYVLNTTVGQRQHDLGYATLLDDGIINPGHLGYVEYIAKFRHLPDFDPFSIFSYYHPPLHHVIAAVVVDIAHGLGVSEPAVYEFIQLPTCIYGCLTVYVAFLILKCLTDDEKNLIIPLALVAFHPGLIYMSGTVNNDMLAALLSFLCIYTTIRWVQTDHSLKYLIFMALSIGIGLISKLNVAVLIFPMGAVMLFRFVRTLKTGETGRCIREYLLFAVISIPTGLSWSIRNLVRFSVKPGISSATPESNQYLGGYPLSEVIGLPVQSSISFPFHSENAVYCHNAWSILFKTSLFGETFPEDISSGMLLFCQAAFVIAILTAFICAILAIVRPIIYIRQGDRELGIFLLVGYTTLLATYILFVIKYPYTCSCDFRYVPTALVYASAALLPVRHRTHTNTQPSSAPQQAQAN